MSDILDDLSTLEDAQAHEKRLRKDYERRLDEQREEIERLSNLLGIIEDIPTKRKVPKWQKPPRSAATHRGIVTLQTTDWHLDEIIRPGQIGYANAYNRDIAGMRIRRLADKTIMLAREYVHGVTIDGIAILATGDLFSGEIHEELARTNAAPIKESFAYWLDPVEAFIEQLASEFNELTLDAVVGNHGRDPGRPVYKNRPQTNIEWLFWKVVERDYRNHPHITIRVADGMDHKVKLYDTNYLITHGDEFRGGTGISGARAPLALGQHRTAVRELALGEPMDYMVVGHFHQYQPPSQGLVMGGSLKGYDEYAHGRRFRPEIAQQALWITTPENGPTMSMPVIVQNRKAEGW